MTFQAALPDQFKRWFADRGWSVRSHQLQLLEKTANGRSTLLIAPTGAGKTLAGFLPSLTSLAAGKTHTVRSGIHTLYISPLKALAVDIERNLQTPVQEMGLPIQIETRTGDTPTHKRQRQTYNPPDILLTTPEQLALLIAANRASDIFDQLRLVIVDELHSLVVSKRGQLLALGLARLRQFSAHFQTIGLSATVADPDGLCRWLVPQTSTGEQADLIELKGGAKPNIEILESGQRIPWAGHSARYAVEDVYAAICKHATTLLFVNTRSQAELLFQELWRVNEQGLEIALHHGSLDAGRRRRVEKAMANNSLRAVVATSTLDLGIDWGDVDLVIHVGAPKGASRLAQRVGRANHRMDEPSQALLVPANRFEVMECRAALEANYLGAQDTPTLSAGAIDVLAQHIWGSACAAPFDANALFDEVRTVLPYADLPRETFDKVLQFVATGGYALKTYERFAKIKQTPDGLWRLSHPRLAQNYRLNLGTIVEAPMLQVRLSRQRGAGQSARGGMILGKVEEYFLETLVPGDSFLFAGRVVSFETIRDNECIVSTASNTEPRIPCYAGGKFPLSTYLASQVRAMLADQERWKALPTQVSQWLELQSDLSTLPQQEELLIETFPRAERHFLVAYPFEGRLAHQTLGMLLTKRLERAGAQPLGFVANDYALAVWGLKDMGAFHEDGRLTMATLFEEDMLGDDLEAWLDESWLLKRTFRNCALISGLIERRHPGKEKSGRQVTISTDLMYDVLREHEPDHILLQATRADAATGLLDIGRLGDMLRRIRNRVTLKRLERISPLAVPIMLEIGKEMVPGGADEALLSDASAELMREATR